MLNYKKIPTQERLLSSSEWSNKPTKADYALWKASRVVLVKFLQESNLVFSSERSTH